MLFGPRHLEVSFPDRGFPDRGSPFHLCQMHLILTPVPTLTPISSSFDNVVMYPSSGLLKMHGLCNYQAPVLFTMVGGNISGSNAVVLCRLSTLENPDYAVFFHLPVWAVALLSLAGSTIYPIHW